MASLNRVPCINLDSTNFEEKWSSVVAKLNAATFIAIDLEFSGIGPKDNFKIKQVDERYEKLLDVARTRSIVAMGLSIFSYSPQEQSEKDVAGDTCTLSYDATTYNLYCRCDDAYALELDAKTFLEDHGFDFERQTSLGIPYHRGNDNSTDEESSTKTLRNLFAAIISAKKPIIFHNGFLDLIFLYENFYCDLPEKFQSFVGDLSELFPEGLYDTKYICEEANVASSFLEFIFYFRQRYMIEQLMYSQPHIQISFELLNDALNDTRNMKTQILGLKPDSVEICKHYSYHGWCTYGVECLKSHNIDIILDNHLFPTSKKADSKKRRKKGSKLRKLRDFNASLDATWFALNNIQIDESGEGDNDNLDLNKSGAHHSGYDAFMTAYVFASYVVSMCDISDLSEKLSSDTPGLQSVINNIFLSGKEQPLKIRISGYSKTSKNHKLKMSKLMAANSL